MKSINISLVKKILLILLPVTALSLIFIPLHSDALTGILLKPLELKYKKKIEFEKSIIRLSSNISMDKVSILDENGQLYYIEDLEVKYNALNILFAKKWVELDLKEVKLYKKMDILNSVADILVISSLPEVEFDGIESLLEIYHNAVYIKELSAYNEKMRIESSGWVGRDGPLDCNIKFLFAESLTDNMPEAIKKTLLVKEEGGWSSIVFKLSGNYKKPTLHIASDILRLNIMEGIIK